MTKGDELMSVIESHRVMSNDGSLVTYDLTTGVDFANPKITAEALAAVFFRKDAANWFKLTEDKIDFCPTYRVRVVLAESHNKLLQETSDNFLKDLSKQDLPDAFAKQIREEVDRDYKIGSVMAAGALRSALFRHSEKNVYKDFIRDDLFTDLLEKIEIRSLNNEDMLNWKNLPL